ncbi:amidase domain-containing protein [Arthrobacter sp. NPDC057013]|uniref:amidase domain-containing protein n=1 Tax=Arthrobacter sp. NPDC057013 TaxID=3345999 RepID=UPI00362F123B
MTAAEAQGILEAAVNDRSGEALATPGLPKLKASKSTKKYKDAKGIEKSVVAARKQRLKGFGFHYTSGSTTIQITDVTGSDVAATVKFDESATLYMASETTGASDTPEQYRVHETASFIKVGGVWVLDEITPDTGQTSLPFSMIDPKDPSETAVTQVAPAPSKGAVPGKKGDKATLEPKKTTNSSDSTMVTTMAVGYDYNAMVYYAMGHYLNYNPNYKAYGNDCTNFVSQSLRQGGWGMYDYGGYYQTNDQWYYYPWIATRSWTSTPDFFAYATWGSGRTYELAYLNSMGPADIEIADWESNGLKDHAMIVTYWASGGTGYNDIRVTYHTTDTLNKSIWTLYSQKPGATWYALRT